MKIMRTIAWVTGLVVIAAAVICYMQYEKMYPSTDDAYVKAHIIQIAPQINGSVTAIYTQDHATVKKGQLLFKLDDKQEQIAVAQAQAGLEQAIQQYHANQMNVDSSKAMVAERKAQLAQAKTHAGRINALVAKKLSPPDEGDEATKDLNVAQATYAASLKQLAQAKDQLGAAGDNNAAIKSARADLAKAQLNLSYTRVTAPTDGYIANFTLRKGDQVTAYQALFSLVANHEYWIEANYKETDLDNIKVGQPATIKIDMYPDQSYTGTVQSISSGSGSSFSVLPPENASGNWVKVTQRFPVKLTFTNPKLASNQLRIGSSAKVTIDTRTK